MPVQVYKTLVKKDQAKQKRKTSKSRQSFGSELDMNSVRENMFLISKDTKVVYFITTHFKSLSRKLHLLNIFTKKKRELTYEVTLFPRSNEEQEKAREKESKKAEKTRKAFIITHDLVKDTILAPLLEAKIKRNKAKRQTKVIIARRKELEKALLFVKEKIAIRKKQKKQRIPSYNEDE